MLLDQPGDEIGVARVADDKLAPSGTAQAKPVERLSSTTTVSPASISPRRHVTADIAGAAGHQNAHVAVLLVNARAASGPKCRVDCRRRTC